LDKNIINLLSAIGMILIIAVSISGCTGSASTNATSIPAQASNPNTIRIGISPSDTQNVINAYTPLKDYLQKETGYDIELDKCIDDSVVFNEMQSKKIEVAFTGPIAYGSSYTAAGYGDPSTRGKGEAFGIGVDENGNTTRYAYIVSTPEVAQALGITTPLRGKEGMTTLKADLEGHKNEYSFKWGDTSSSYAFGMQRLTMDDVGMKLSDLTTKTGFASSQVSAVTGVSENTTDISTVSSVIFDNLTSGGAINSSNVKILWISDPVQNPPVYYRSDLPQDVKDKLENAILNAPAEVIKPTGISHYKSCDNSTYADMPAIATRLGKIASIGE